MKLHPIELTILEKLKSGEVHGAATLGSFVFPSDKSNRSQQGLAISVARFLRNLEGAGCLNYRTTVGDSMKIYFITEQGRLVLEEENLRILNEQSIQMQLPIN